jgi:alkylation response protein AidB-like acyl-CoA dehydrogenase
MDMAEVAEAYDPVAAARSLRPLLAAHAVEAEQSGRIAQPVMDALWAAGLFDVLTPRRAGGPSCKQITHLQVIAELAKGCAGSAWAYGLLSSIRGAAKSMAPAATDILFAKGDELFCAVSSLTGTARPVDDGYVIDGRWGYASGCLHAAWGLMGVRILDAAGQPIDTGFAITPLQDPHVRIEPTWNVEGVKASGSNTVVANGAHIPSCLILADSHRPSPQALLATSTAEPRDRWPIEPRFPLGVLASMLGAAEAIRDGVAEALNGKAVVGWDYVAQGDSQVLVQQFGEAAMEIDSAWLHIRRAAAELDETAQHRVLSGYDKAHIQADCGYAMAQLRRAADRLMDIAGPSAFATASPLQRFWRDLSFGSRHTALQSRLSLELYGRAIVGRPSNLDLLPDIGFA